MWCNIFDIIYNRIIVFWCRLEHSELKTQIKLNVKSTIRSLTDEERCLKKEGKVKATYIFYYQVSLSATGPVRMFYVRFILINLS